MANSNVSIAVIAQAHTVFGNVNVFLMFDLEMYVSVTEYNIRYAPLDGEQVTVNMSPWP